jgi:hypothetical protein
VSERSGNQPRRFSVALLGGMRASGRFRVDDRIVRVTTIGGLDLDLSEAEFTAPTLTIVKVSLIGGTELTVPSDASVEVRGIAIGGEKVEPTTDASGPRIVLHNYGLLGGVKVRRRARGATPGP